jgi:collagenase-like PrtC family protease
MENNYRNSYKISVSVSDISKIEYLDIEQIDLLIAGNPFCRQSFNNPTENLYSLEKTLEILAPNLDKTIISLPVCPLDSELVYLGRMLEYLSTTRIHGVEVHSAGMAYKINAHYPGLKTYFGCFANVYTDQCANLMKDMNVMGGMLPFELNLDEVEYIKNSSNLPIWLPVFGNYPIAFSQYCYFHPDQTEFPFHCDKNCEEKVIVDYGEDRKVIHKGRAIFSQKCLSMFTHLQMLINKGFRYFRVSGLIQPADAVNGIVRIFRAEIEDILTAHAAGQKRSEDFGASLNEKLKEYAPDGFSNGFFFTKRGMDYVENLYKFSKM